MFYHFFSDEADQETSLSYMKHFVTNTHKQPYHWPAFTQDQAHSLNHNQTFCLTLALSPRRVFHVVTVAVGNITVPLQDQPRASGPFQYGQNVTRSNLKPYRRPLRHLDLIHSTIEITLSCSQHAFAADNHTLTLLSKPSTTVSQNYLYTSVLLHFHLSDQLEKLWRIQPGRTCVVPFYVALIVPS